MITEAIIFKIDIIHLFLKGNLQVLLISLFAEVTDMLKNIINSCPLIH